MMCFRKEYLGEFIVLNLQYKFLFLRLLNIFLVDFSFSIIRIFLLCTYLFAIYLATNSYQLL